MMPLNFYKVLVNLQFQICLSSNATRVPVMLFPSLAIFFLRKLSFHVVPFLNKFILTLIHSSLSICPFFSPILSSKATRIPISSRSLAYLTSPYNLSFWTNNYCTFPFETKILPCVYIAIQLFIPSRICIKLFLHSNCLNSLLQITFLIK